MRSSATAFFTEGPRRPLIANEQLCLAIGLHGEVSGLLLLRHWHLVQDFAPAGRFSLQDTAMASLTDARQQARELQEQLRGRLGSVYLEQCRTVAPDFRARGRRHD